MQININYATFILALVGAVSGWICYWINKTKLDKQIATQKDIAIAIKAVNDERDFIHLRNNQKDISDGIAHGFNEMDHRLDDIDRGLLKIEAWLIRGNGNPIDHE